jgi:hypothetical protein
MPRKSELPSEVRRFIVERLAYFDSPTIEVEAVKKGFGLTVDRQTVERYDPSKVAGQNLAAALRERFYKVREKFRADLLACFESPRAPGMASGCLRATLSSVA